MSPSKRRGYTSAFAVLLLGTAATTALHRAAAGDDRPVDPACKFVDIDVDKYGHQPFQNPPDLRSSGGALTTNLQVKLTDPAKVKLAGCGVSLRTYNGALVGPTLRIKPGDTMNVTLDNKLPAETPQTQADQLAQQQAVAFLSTSPNPYNTTNLHTHGLHVSPQGNSDNVLLAIAPQTSFPYEIKVPTTHPPGTFWYHAHAHGSTAIQVGSGMEGALIIEDDPARIPAALREANKREKVFVIQTLLYDATGRAEDITAFFPDSPDTQKLCDAGKSGCTWQSSKRRVTVNGQIIPIIKMQPGEVQRWRFVDAAFRESLSLALDGHPLHEIALDGLYLGRVDTWLPGQPIDLEPGYRSDVLVQASLAPGRYKLRDLSTPASLSLRGLAEDENVIAEIVVEGKPLKMTLPSSAEMAKLAPFPGVDLTRTADGVQIAQFQIGSAYSPTDQRNYFQINSHPFNPQHVRQLQLGATEMWSLSTVGDVAGVPNCPPASASCGPIPPLPHVFHIHINPFQVSRPDPAGKPELVWKDTVIVLPGKPINIYTRYLDYIGKFVMHCHILDHEDLGMMELIEIVGAAPMAHGHEGH